MTTALIDSSTKVLLAHSPHPAAIVFLQECTNDSDIAANVHYPNYPDGSFFSSLSTADHPAWTWDGRRRAFIPTRADLITDALRTKSALAQAKAEMIIRIMNIINVTRFKVRRGVDFQDSIYLIKRLQAQDFRERGWPSDLIYQFPYVAQCADALGVSYKVAAEEILLKAQLQDQYLARTEALRMKYFSAVRLEADPARLPSIYDEFFDACFTNTPV